MKGISPMIATVLLIGFTVAVGAILAVWFSTFTKTQTASVSKSSSCSTILADVSGLSPPSGDKLTILITNPGDQKITLKSIIIKCGNNVGIVNNESKLVPVDASSQNTTQINLTSEVNPPLSLSECTESNIGIKITYNCSKGGTNSAECPEGTCFA